MDAFINNSEITNDTLGEGFFDDASDDYSDEDDEYRDLDYEEELRNSSKEFKACTCLPSCSSIDYDVEISQSSIDIQRHLKANKVFEEEDEG
jgi:hypothetical protein